MRPLLAATLAVVVAGLVWLAWPSEPVVHDGRRAGPRADADTRTRAGHRTGAAEPGNAAPGTARRSTAGATREGFRPREDQEKPMRQKPPGKTGVYRPPPAPEARPRDSRRTRPREIEGLRKVEPAEREAAQRATLKVIEAIDAPADAAARSSNFVQFTTDRFTDRLPDGVEARVPSQPSDTLVTAYFATRNLGATVERCTFSWWMEGMDQPFRTVTAAVNRRWLHQVDTLELDGEEWPAGAYHVLVHAVTKESELVAAGSFEIRPPVVFQVSGLEVLLDDRVVGVSCVIDPEKKTTLTVRFASVAAAGRKVHVGIAHADGKSAWVEDATLESPADRPKVEQLSVTRRWAPGRYMCMVVEAAAVLQRIEFTIKPPPPKDQPKD